MCGDRVTGDWPTATVSGLTLNARCPMVLRQGKVEIASSRLLSKISALEVSDAIKTHDVIRGASSGDPAEA